MANLGKRLVLRLVVGLALAGASAGLLPAGTEPTPGSAHFTADPATLYQSATAKPAPAGADVVVLEDQDSYVFDAQGRKVHTQYVVFRVLTQQGAEDWANYSAPWEPWHEERPVLRARVITPDRAAHELDPKTIADAPAKQENDDTYSDRRVVRAPLPAMAPGSVVEEESVTKDSAPFFGAGMVEHSFFGRGVPVEHTRLLLDAPASLPLHYTLELLPEVKPQRSEGNGRVQIVFEHGSMPAQEDAEPYLPSDQPAYPHVTFSTGSSWQQVAEEYGKIVDGRLAAAEVKPLAGKLVAGKRTRQEKAEALLQYVDKEVRYTGVEFGDAAIVPRTPAEVLKQKYGDCKDKAALLVALLRAAGLPAYVALLNAGDREDVALELPGLGVFDHAIVYAPGEPELWIDVTDEYARLGELPTGDQGRWALVTGAGRDSLVRTPVSSAQDNTLVEKREFYLTEYGPARVVETSEPRGSLESAYRSAYADQQNKKTREDLTDYMKSQYLAEKLDRMERSDPQDLSRQFELVLESKKAKRGYTDLESAVAAIRLGSLFNRLPEELRQRESEEDKKEEEGGGKAKKKRTADYQLPAAFVTEWDYSIVPPAGFQPKALPPGTRIALGPAVLTEEFEAGKDGVAHAVIRFDTVKRRLTAAEAAEMRERVAQLREGEALLISFEPAGQALLRQGKAREAFQAYRAPIAQFPKDAVPHLRLAKAMLAAGMGEAAREEARLGVKLEPDSALAEKTLAEILEYDLVGRQFRPGSDLAGADVAFRAAEKLDPDDKTTVGNHAILLEYNPEGTRYGPGARLKEAIEEYRKLTPEQLAEVGLKNNLAFALFYAKEFAEARKQGESLNPQPNALIVACEAAQHGSQAGLAEANKRGSGEGAFKQTARTAGEMLMNVRKYALAADLLEAGTGGDSAARTVALVALLRQARPREELHFADDPTGTAMRFVLASGAPNLSQEQLEGFWSRNAQVVLRRTDPEELKRSLESARRVVSRARGGVLPDALLDLVAQSMQPTVEGNDTSGYRVRVRVAGGKTATFFVVKEGGQYKILDSNEKPNAIGLEILDRAAAGDLAGARVLLDWLREEQHLAGGDDPLAGAAFPRMWTKGKEADGEQMKLAAAAILVQTKPTAAQGVAILEAARNSAKSDADKVNLELAMLTGYSNLEEYQKERAVAAELEKQYPESRRVFLSETFALRALGRFAEAEALAQERLKRLPDDLDAMRALEYSAVGREDYNAAHALAQKIVDTGKAEANDLNALAWFSLFTGKVSEADIENAIKATQASPNNAGILHTLGCLYAETGKTKEAREVLVQAMDLLNLDEPDPNYWYAFGRIAEQYGENQVAVADYAKVTKPKQTIEIPDSSYWLAQMRLKVLGGAR